MYSRQTLLADRDLATSTPLSETIICFRSSLTAQSLEVELLEQRYTSENNLAVENRGRLASPTLEWATSSDDALLLDNDPESTGATVQFEGKLRGQVVRFDL